MPVFPFASPNARLIPLVFQECALVHCLVLIRHLLLAPEVHAYVEAACTIVHRETLPRGALVLVSIASLVVEAETFALCLLQIDAHHGLSAGLVACAGVLHYFHPAYLVALQALQLF